MSTNLFILTTLFYHDVSSSRFKKTSNGASLDLYSHVPGAMPSSRKPTPAPSVASSMTTVSASRTTSDSSVIAVTVNDAAKSKKSTKCSQPPRSGWGLREDETVFEDESAERDAAHSSPLKGTDRLANAVGHISSSAIFLTRVSCSLVSGLSMSRLRQSAREVKRS